MNYILFLLIGLLFFCFLKLNHCWEIESKAWNQKKEFNLQLCVQETKNQGASKLDALYDEIRPAIEEHERDSQDSVPTSVAERWIGVSCGALETEFDLYASIIKNLANALQRPRDDVMSRGGDGENGIRYLENGHWGGLV